MAISLPPRTFPARPRLPLAGFACAALAVLIAWLAAAPDPMVKGFIGRGLDALGVEAPALRHWVLDSPKLGHAFFFGALALALLLALPGRPHTAALAAFGLGAFLEAAQLFTETRTARLGDLLYNGAGVGAAYILFAVRAIRQEENQSPKLEIRNETDYLEAWIADDDLAADLAELGIRLDRDRTAGRAAGTAHDEGYARSA